MGDHALCEGERVNNLLIGSDAAAVSAMNTPEAKLKRKEKFRNPASGSEEFALIGGISGSTSPCSQPNGFGVSPPGHTLKNARSSLIETQ